MWLRSARWSVVVTDAGLPEIDGLTLIQHVRDLCAETTFIAVSASTEPSSYLRGPRMAGVSATFEKPYSVDDLLQCLREVAQNGRGVKRAAKSCGDPVLRADAHPSPLRSSAFASGPEKKAPGLPC
jgi:DNA-binding response OmpR family regulator